MATTSIVDYLRSQGQDSSFSARAQLARQFGIQNYQGTAQQNTQLLGLLQGGQQIQQNNQPQNNQIEIQRVQQELAQKQAELARQQQIEAIQAKIAPLQQQVQNATVAGYGEGGKYVGQDIPDEILSGEQAVYDTGNQQLNDILNELSGVIKKMADAGKVVNPEIELTPTQIQEFTDLASSQISPYYRSQIESIKSDLTKSIENLQKQYEISKKTAEEGFKSSLGASREQRAGVGTVFSGTRGAAEQSMVEAQNRALDLSGLQTEEQIGSNLRSLEGKIGTANLPTLPQFQGYKASAEGEGGFTPGRVLNFATTGGVAGELPQSEKEAIELRKSKYKQAAREQRSLDYYL